MVKNIKWNPTKISLPEPPPEIEPPIAQEDNEDRAIHPEEYYFQPHLKKHLRR